MIKIIGVSIAIVLCSALLKDYNKSIAIFLSIGGVIIVFICMSQNIKELIDKINSLSSSISGSINYVRLMIKILGIVLISQLAINICKDNGEGTLASLVEISSKIVVLVMIMPLFEMVINLVVGMLK